MIKKDEIKKRFKQDLETFQKDIGKNIDWKNTEVYSDTDLPNELTNPKTCTIEKELGHIGRKIITIILIVATGFCIVVSDEHRYHIPEKTYFIPEHTIQQFVSQSATPTDYFNIPGIDYKENEVYLFNKEFGNENINKISQNNLKNGIFDNHISSSTKVSGSSSG